MLNSPDKISLSISLEIGFDKEGNRSAGVTIPKGTKLFPDGSVTVDEHEIIIFEGSIKQGINENSLEKDLQGLSVDEIIGIVGGHEQGHTENSNIKMSVENRQKRMNIHDVEAEPTRTDKKINIETRMNNFFKSLLNVE